MRISLQPSLKKQCNRCISENLNATVSAEEISGSHVTIFDQSPASRPLSLNIKLTLLILMRTQSAQSTLSIESFHLNRGQQGLRPVSFGFLSKQFQNLKLQNLTGFELGSLEQRHDPQAGVTSTVKVTILSSVPRPKRPKMDLKS